MLAELKTLGFNDPDASIDGADTTVCGHLNSWYSTIKSNSSQVSDLIDDMRVFSGEDIRAIVSALSGIPGVNRIRFEDGLCASDKLVGTHRI